MNGTYKIAEVNIQINSLHHDVHDYCTDYRTQNPPDIIITTSQADIDFERNKSSSEYHFTEGYFEELAVYRKISEHMIDYDTFLFHGSAVSVDGNCYMFTAPSGTGKSTHASLWVKLLGERAVMVNDDKPLIHIGEHGPIVCGTPWNGKHRRGTNTSAPLKAICILERSDVNVIRELSVSEAYPGLLRQVYRPADGVLLARTLELLDKMASSVKLYRLGCNMIIEAAELSYNTMKAPQD